MKSFVRRTTKTAAECQAELAGIEAGAEAGTGAATEAKWKGTRGSWGQAQIASFAFARTQDKAQEGTAWGRGTGEQGEKKHDDDADEAVRKTVGRIEGRQEEGNWLAAYPEGGKQGAARTHLPCHEPLTVSWRRCRCRCRCRCSFLTLRLVASHLKLCWKAERADPVGRAVNGEERIKRRGRLFITSSITDLL